MKTYRLKESIHIDAPIERCFLLSTSIEIVQMTLGMTPVAGKVSGLIVLGDRLLWRGWKFGLPAWHETLITGYDRPNFFQDTMGSGMFHHFQHDHRFDDIDGQTLLSDVVVFTMPLGPIGNYMAKKVVVPHILNTMVRRFELIKRIAESAEWRDYLPAASQVSVEAPANEEDGIQRV